MWAHDPSLRLPRAMRGAVRALPLELALPSLAATPARVAFVVRGGNALAAGRLDHPRFDLWCDALRAATLLGIGEAHVLDTRTTALGIVRRLGVGESVVTERIFVPRLLPAAVIEWSLEEGGARPLALRLTWRLDDDAFLSNPGPNSLWNAGARAAVGCTGRNAVAFALSSACDAFRITHVDDRLDCAADLALSAEPARLFIAGVRSGLDDALASLDRCADPASLVRSRAASLRRSARERLSIGAPDPAIGAALAWAGVRLDDQLAAASAPADPVLNPDGTTGLLATPGHVRACAGLAALAIGDFAGAGSALLGLAEPWQGGERPGTGAVATEPEGLDAACFLLLAARHVRWTADAGLFASLLPAARRAVARIVALAGSEGPWWIALDEIARGAEVLEPGFSAEASSAAASLNVAGAHPPVASSDDMIWNVLLDRVFRSRYGPALDAWAHFLAGRSGSGLRAWTASILAPIENGNALWDAVLDGSDRATAEGEPVRRIVDDPLATALAVLPLVHGLLGASPDAARHWLRLRPHLPESWNRWSVNDLRMADARIALSAERDGDRIALRVAQTAGALPVTLIVEAVVPEPRIAAIRIDGRHATLDVRRFGDGLLVPVQLVLDEERALVLELN